jgi:quinolinate synthase
MYRIDQPHLLWILDNLVGQFDGRAKGGKPKIVNQVSVHPKARASALKALDRMLGLTGPKKTQLAAVD